MTALECGAGAVRH